MERVLLNRQPIYHPDLKVLKYKLLFQNTDADKTNVRDPEEATAQVIVNALMEIGLDQMVGPHLAFINVSRNFLLSDFYEALPPSRVVFELLDPIEIDPALAKHVDQLINLKYQITTKEFIF